MGRYLDIAHATPQDEEAESPAPSDSAHASTEEQLSDPDCLPPPHNEALAMLRQHPELTHAFVTTDNDDPDYVHVVVAIRDKGTCELRIPRDKYDGLEMLEWI